MKLTVFTDVSYTDVELECAKKELAEALAHGLRVMQEPLSDNPAGK